MKKVHILTLYLVFHSLLGLGQTPQQKVTDRTFVSLNLINHIEVNGQIYSVGLNRATDEYYPAFIKQDADLTIDYLGLPYNGGYFPDKFQTLTGIIEGANSSLIMSGAQGVLGGGASTWLINIDTNANVIWERQFDISPYNEGFDLISDNANGGVILAMESQCLGCPRTSEIMRFNSNGDTLWTKQIVSTNNNSISDRDGYQKPNNDFLFTFRDGAGSGFLELDQNGAYLDYSFYQESSGDMLRVSSMESVGNSVYMCGGLSSGSAVLLEMDHNGNIVWAKEYPELNQFSSLKVMSNGNIVASSNNFTGPNINRTTVLMTDAAGTPIVAKAYGKLPELNTGYGDILELDNHLYLCGERRYQQNRSAYQLVLDFDLNSNSCYESILTVTNNTLSFTKSAGTIILNSIPINSYGSPAVTAVVYGGAFFDYTLNNSILTTLSTTDDDCGGSCIGTADVAATGGDPSYNFNWSNGQSGNLATGLCSNSTVYLETSDQLGCYVYDTINIGQMAAAPDICMVSVDTVSDYNHNLIVWEKTGMSGNIDGYKIYRNVVGNYSLIGYVPYDSLSQYIDSTTGVDPMITSYRYKISAIDTCGNESDLSDYHETIHVTSSYGINGNVNLIWDNYEGFSYSYYRILKDTTNDGTNNFYVVDSVSSTNFTWTDPNIDTYAQYIIEIVIPQSCTSTRANHNTTRSNRTQPGINGGGNPTAIFELNESNVILYPNPARDHISLKFSSSNIDKLSISLFHSSGKMIQTLNESSIENGVIQLNTSGLSNGIYIVRIVSGENFITKKVMISH